VTIRHQPANGGEIRVHSRRLPDGRRHVEAYQNTRDPKTGTRTRLYHDGRRVIFGRDFVTRSAPGRPVLTTFNSGLREAYLPDRRRYFHEEFARHRDRHGHEQRVIRRTVYVNYVSGRPVMLASPVVRHYGMVPIRNVVVYSYYPTHFDPPYYTWFNRPLATPLFVSASCLLCPPPVVRFYEPVEVYRDPVDLLSDSMLAGAMEDGYSSRVVSSSTDAEVQALSETVASLQQEVSSASRENELLRQELSEQQIQLDVLQDRLDTESASGVERLPVPIPEPVRRKFRSQVAADLLAHQEEQPLSLAELIASPQGTEYLFQVSEMLEATEVQSGEECLLTTGDLVRLDQLPEADESSAQVRVVTGKMDSCRANSVINVSLWDLQEMLNVYRQRLEENMQKVHRELTRS
jgi:hypothetical protein